MPSDPRIGLLALHWGKYDSSLPPEHRREKEALARQVADVLGQCGSVIFPGLVTDEASGAAARRSFESKIDVVVVLPCMAAPPTFGWEALVGLPDAPVVFWNAHLMETISEDLESTDVVRHSSNVGMAMLTNVLNREGRPFRAFTGWRNNPAFTERAIRGIRAGAAVGRLRRARLGILGDVIPGYIDVKVDRNALKRDLGIELIDIPQGELTGTFHSVGPAQEEVVLTEMRNWSIEGLTEADQRRSARLAAALEQLVERHQLDGGAVNCHTPYFLENPVIGIVACYAVSRLVGRGVTFTCTGDIPTAVAALILKLLGANAQWCELVLTDYTQDYVLLSNTGEGDPTIATHSKTIRLLPNARFRRGSFCGACLSFPFRPGPATLVSFSPVKAAQRGWCMAVAEGTILERHFRKIGSPNAGFRFKNGDSASAFDRWCLRGATHHSVLTAGDYVAMLCEVAEFLGIEAQVV